VVRGGVGLPWLHILLALPRGYAPDATAVLRVSQRLG
jgi:hypothetical protein